MRVLKGHTSPETAYMVGAYPFGSQLRCVQLYWIETAEKGAKAGQQRLVSMTSHKSFNRRYTDKLNAEGQEAADAWARSLMVAADGLPANRIPWNAAKGSTYSDILVMGLEPLPDGSGRDGVTTRAAGPYCTAEGFANFRRDYYGHLTEAQQKRFDAIERYSRRMSPSHWAEYDAKQAAPSLPDIAAETDRLDLAENQARVPAVA